MNIKDFFLIPGVVFFSVVICSAQPAKKAVTAPPTSINSSAAQTIKSTPAYAEILLRKTELESELEDLLVAYTDEFPKVKEIRRELNLIQRDLARLLSQNAADAAKMTLALGKLLVRRAELETDAWSLQTKYGVEHPDVKRALRRVSTFEKAISEILP